MHAHPGSRPILSRGLQFGPSVGPSTIDQSPIKLCASYRVTVQGAREVDSTGAQPHMQAEGLHELTT
jgi:hypothetical protein